MPRPIDVIQNSRTYQIAMIIRTWAGHSVVGRLLDDERVLVGSLGVIILLSLVRILVSDLHATVKFLSFALLFVVLTALTWNYTEPFPDS